MLSASRLVLYRTQLPGTRGMSELTLNTLAILPGQRQQRMRVGRGIGSGKGKSAGRGQGGQYQRNTVRLGFEGGQTPLYRLLPKIGFNNVNALDMNEVNLEKLQYFIETGRIDARQPITFSTLYQSGLIKKARDGVKLLGVGAETFRHAISIEVTRASKSAIEAVEREGGKIVCRYYNRLGLRFQTHPHKFPLPIKMADPNNPKLLEFYRNPENRGYLAPATTSETSSSSSSSSSQPTAEVA